MQSLYHGDVVCSVSDGRSDRTLRRLFHHFDNFCFLQWGHLAANDRAAPAGQLTEVANALSLLEDRCDAAKLREGSINTLGRIYLAHM